MTISRSSFYHSLKSVEEGELLMNEVEIFTSSEIFVSNNRTWREMRSVKITSCCLCVASQLISRGTRNYPLPWLLQFISKPQPRLERCRLYVWDVMNLWGDQLGDNNQTGAATRHTGCLPFCLGSCSHHRKYSVLLCNNIITLCLTDRQTDEKTVSNTIYVKKHSYSRCELWSETSIPLHWWIKKKNNFDLFKWVALQLC